MIILDIETGGLDPAKHALLSIGAVDYDNGDEFYGEARANPTDEIDDFALGVNGFTREQCHDITKQTVAHLYVKFLQWSVGRGTLLAGQQVGSFDILFLKRLHASPDITFIGTLPDGTTVPTKLDWQFGHRSLDLHSVAFAKLGKSLSLDGILTAVGLSPEPKPHNALTGARLERDAFRRLLA